jgi:hypothetical protein
MTHWPRAEHYCSPDELRLHWQVLSLDAQAARVCSLIEGDRLISCDLKLAVIAAVRAQREQAREQFRATTGGRQYFNALERFFAESEELQRQVAA